jgi:hypothetical protein
MSAPPYVSIDHASAWRASERGKDSFVIRLQQRHLDAFDRALRAAGQKTTDAEAITRDDFPLSEIEDDVTTWSTATSTKRMRASKRRARALR